MKLCFHIFGVIVPVVIVLFLFNGVKASYLRKSEYDENRKNGVDSSFYKSKRKHKGVDELIWQFSSSKEKRKAIPTSEGSNSRILKNQSKNDQKNNQKNKQRNDKENNKKNDQKNNEKNNQKNNKQKNNKQKNNQKDNKNSKEQDNKSGKTLSWSHECDITDGVIDAEIKYYDKKSANIGSQTERNVLPSRTVTVTAHEDTKILILSLVGSEEGVVNKDLLSSHCNGPSRKFHEHGYYYIRGNLCWKLYNFSSVDKIEDVVQCFHSDESPEPTGAPTLAPTLAPTNPSTTVDNGNSNTIPTNDAQEWLEAHNEKRRYWHGQYGVPYKPLQWNSVLATQALIWAKYLADERNCRIEHVVGDVGGENISENSDIQNPKQILTRWTDNELYFEYPRNGHFLQVIWRSSSYVGCASYYNNICQMSVCRYVSPGNCDVDNKNWRTMVVEEKTYCSPQVPCAEIDSQGRCI